MLEGKGPDGFWIKGEIESLPTQFECGVRVNGKTYSLKDLEPIKRKGLKIGQKVILTFPAKNRYYAKDIEIVDEIEVEMKQKDWSETIRDITPFAPEVISSLDEGERRDLLNIFQHALTVASSIYNTHASYEDTKKDTEDGAVKVIEIAFEIAITVDANTLQILKKHAPVKT